MSEDDTPVVIGQRVYDGEGNELGAVRGFDEQGFVVSTENGVVGMSIKHERAGHAVAEAELTWQCAQCGAIGDIEALPETCPDCGAPTEEIFYRIDD